MNRKQAFRRGTIAGAVGALMIGAVACGGDRATAPAASPVVARPTYSTDKSSKDTNVTTFVVNPGRDTKIAINGGHVVKIPADALCDPATSGYGPTVWEKACTPATTDVTITAYSWTDYEGHPYVRFSPDVRFTPDDAKVTLLYMLDKSAVKEPHMSILFCPTGSTRCIDEAATDPELATRVDYKNGFLYRRIKHFSGYNISTGLSTATVE